MVDGSISGRVTPKTAWYSVFRVVGRLDHPMIAGHGTTSANRSPSGHDGATLWVLLKVRITGGLTSVKVKLSISVLVWRSKDSVFRMFYFVDVGLLHWSLGGIIKKEGCRRREVIFLL